MIKNSNLIGSVIAPPHDWKEFKVLDILMLENSPMSNTICLNVGQVSAGEGSLGVVKYVETNLYDDNIITISKLGQAFYHEKCVTWTDDVLGLGLKVKSNNVGMFLASIISKQTRAVSSYGHQFRMKRLDELTLELPVTLAGLPDYEWMSSYVRELERKRIRELDAYLQVTGLDNTKLTSEEEKALSDWRDYETTGHGNLKFKKFRINDLFEVVLSLGDNKISELVDGNVPLITSGDSNNGIAGYIANGDGKSQLFDEGLLTADMFGNVFFQDAPFYAVSHGRVNILRPLVKGLSQRVLIFIASVIKKQTIGHYGFDYMLSSSRLTDLVIDLPITGDDRPDYEFMEIFIRAQEKLSMTRLSDFRAKQIAETKALIRP